MTTLTWVINHKAGPRTQWLELPSLHYLWLGHYSGNAFVERMSRLMPERYRAGRSGDSPML